MTLTESDSDTYTEQACTLHSTGYSVTTLGQPFDFHFDFEFSSRFIEFLGAVGLQIDCKLDT